VRAKGDIEGKGRFETLLEVLAIKGEAEGANPSGLLEGSPPAFEARGGLDAVLGGESLQGGA
jgi:hypothetical protein